MSRSALYQGLGAGLMELGQGMRQNQAETARARREEALMNMRRQWQIEDRDAGWERDDARDAEQWQRTIDEKTRDDAIQFGRQQMALQDQRDYEAPERDARLGLLGAQTRATDARAQQVQAAAEQGGPQSMDAIRRNPQLFMPGTSVLAIEQDRPELAIPRDQGFRMIQQRNQQVMEAVQEASGMMAPAQKREMGITDGMSPTEERRVLFNHFLPAVNEQFFMLYSGAIPEESLRHVLSFQEPEQVEQVDGGGDPFAGSANPESYQRQGIAPVISKEAGGLLSREVDFARRDPGAYAASVGSNLMKPVDYVFGRPARAVRDQVVRPFADGFETRGGQEPSSAPPTINPEASQGSRNNPIPVKEIEGEPRPGVFYLHPTHGMVRWDAQNEGWTR